MKLFTYICSQITLSIENLIIIYEKQQQYEECF